MSDHRLSHRIVTFVNIAHAIDHFVLLVYPTAVLAIAIEQGLDYAALIGLSTGTFVAFGLCSLPVGWIAERVGRRNMLLIFFIGSGIACLGMASASGAVAFAAWLLLLGMFAAIYHPIGASMLVANSERLGKALGTNAVWGNVGAASASAITAGLAATLGWRAAFLVPGLICIGIGIAFHLLVRHEGSGLHSARQHSHDTPTASPYLLLAAFAIMVIAGGITFNVTTIALPKVIDERLGLALPLMLTGSLATMIFMVGAIVQLLIGRLVDRFSLPALFVMLASLQPTGLALAALSTGVPMLTGLAMAMASIYGTVVVNDAMVARYVPVTHRAKAYSVRYFLGFTAAGFAVPLIAWLHERGGFPIVLSATALFGAVILLSALAFMLIVRRETRAPQGAPAE